MNSQASLINDDHSFCIKQFQPPQKKQCFLTYGNDKVDLHSGSPPSPLTTCKGSKCMVEPHLMSSAQCYTLVFASSLAQTLEMIPMGKITDIPGNCSGFEMRHHSHDLLITEDLWEKPSSHLVAALPVSSSTLEPRVPKYGHLQLIPLGLVEASNNDRQHEAILGTLRSRHRFPFYLTFVSNDPFRSINSLLSFFQHIFK